VWVEGGKVGAEEKGCWTEVLRGELRVFEMDGFFQLTISNEGLKRERETCAKRKVWTSKRQIDLNV